MLEKFLVVLTSILSIVALILLPLNLLGGIVSGIWLAIIGNWAVIGWGILLLLAGPFLISILMMPGIAAAVPGLALMEKGKKYLAAPFLLLGLIVTYAVIVAWCMGILWFMIEAENSRNIIPLLIWSFGVATGPWTYMASKENNEYSMITAFFAQIGFLGTIISYGAFDYSLEESALPLIFILGFGLTMQIMMTLGPIFARKVPHI